MILSKTFRAQEGVFRAQPGYPTTETELSGRNKLLLSEAVEKNLASNGVTGPVHRNTHMQKES